MFSFPLPPPTMFSTLFNLGFLNLSRLKAFEDDKAKVTENLRYELERIVLNIMGKGENAGYQHFLFATLFSKAFSHRVIKSRDCVIKT